MKKPFVIGFCGAAGSGKSTAATFIETANVYAAERVSFAAPLKQMVAATGVPLKHLYGTPEQKAEPLAMLGGKSARFAMQTLGTEWGREVMGANLWVSLWLNRVEALGDFRDGVVIADDVRFANEVEAIRKLGGFVVKIIRDADECADAAHVSEDWRSLQTDYTVHNHGNLAQFRKDVSVLIETLRQRRAA